MEELFGSSDPNSETLPLSSALKEAQKMLEKAAKFVPDAAGLAERIGSARTELDDILEDVTTMNSRVELSQERLEAVDERLSLLYDLMKGYSAASVSELIAKRDALSESLFDSTALEARKTELEGLMASERKALEAVSKRLHDARVKASGPFSKAITESVRSLEMDYAVFRIELSTAPLSASGSRSPLPV